MLSACARQSFPPGGPPDERPPRIVATVPDTFAVVEPGGDRIEIRFSERISESPVEGPLRDAVVVSPATGEARVEHTRTGLRVDLLGGFRPGTVYRVTVLPVIEDMFGNRMVDSYEFVFSTGPAFEEGVLAGAVTDRLEGEAVAGARVEATPRAPEAEPEAERERAPHVTFTDSTGIFALRYLPAGEYRLRAWNDRDRDREVGFLEPSDSRAVRLGPADTAVVELRLLPADTTAPELARTEAVSGRAIHLLFDDPLPEDDPGEGVQVRVTRGELGPEVPVAAVLSLADYVRRLDSLEVAPVPDTVVVGIEDPVPDTLRPAPDTAVARAEAAAEARRRLPTGVDPEVPNPHLFVVLEREMEPGVEYRVEVSRVRNVQGVGGGGGEGAVIRPAPARQEEEPQEEPQQGVPPEESDGRSEDGGAGERGPEGDP